jgi:AcrR family transcriptional regulator
MIECRHQEFMSRLACVSSVDVAQDESGVPSGDAHPDGRRARRDRNREAVVDAYLDLVNEGHLEPSVAEVAERSGVSHRSVFRYFSDRESLVQAGIQCQIRRVEPLLALPVTADMPLDERIAGFARQRVTMLERISPVARLTRLRVNQSEQLAAIVDQARTFFRNQARQLFQPELDALDPDTASDVLATIAVLTSFETFDLLARAQQMPHDRVERIFRRSITAVLVR